MPTITATIEIDCPEGYEPVAFRMPMSRDLFIDGCGQLCECKMGVPTLRALIVRRVWRPAAWMPKGAWLYPELASWFFALEKPKKQHSLQYEGLNWGSDDPCNAVYWAKIVGETFVPPPTREPVQIK